MSVTRKWSLLAAVLVVAILAAGWFLLVSPKRSDAADLRTQKVSQDAANERLVQELEVLKAQQAELPRQRAELAVMRKQLPDNPALPTLVRSLTEAGRKIGVDIVTMAPSVPVAVVAPVAATTVAPSTETSSDSSTESSDEGSAASDSASTTSTTTTPQPTGPALYQVPLTLEVNGSYFELEQFVNKLEGLRRSFLVTGFTLTTPDSAASTGAADSGTTLSPGDLTLSLQGRVFLSPKATTATQPTPVASTTAGQ